MLPVIGGEDNSDMRHAREKWGRKTLKVMSCMSHIKIMLPTEGGKHISELDLTRLDGVKGSRRGQGEVNEGDMGSLRGKGGVKHFDDLQC